MLLRYPNRGTIKDLKDFDTFVFCQPSGIAGLRTVNPYTCLSLSKFFDKRAGHPNIVAKILRIKTLLLSRMT